MTRRAVPKTEFLGVELDGRRVGHVFVDSDGDRDEWEMHPADDEFLSCKMLFVSGETLHRPYVPDDGWS
jgi:hypothetical protein